MEKKLTVLVLSYRGQLVILWYNSGLLWKPSFPSANFIFPIANSKRTHLNKVGIHTMEWRLLICSCCFNPSSFNIIEGRSSEIPFDTMPGNSSVIKKNFYHIKQMVNFSLFCFFVLGPPVLPGLMNLDLSVCLILNAIF